VTAGKLVIDLGNLTGHAGQRSLAITSGVDAVNTSESWDVDTK